MRKVVQGIIRSTRVGVGRVRIEAMGRVGVGCNSVERDKEEREGSAAWRVGVSR